MARSARNPWEFEELQPTTPRTNPTTSTTSQVGPSQIKTQPVTKVFCDEFMKFISTCLKNAQELANKSAFIFCVFCISRLMCALLPFLFDCQALIEIVYPQLQIPLHECARIVSELGKGNTTLDAILEIAKRTDLPLCEKGNDTLAMQAVCMVKNASQIMDQANVKASRLQIVLEGHNPNIFQVDDAFNGKDLARRFEYLSSKGDLMKFVDRAKSQVQTTIASYYTKDTIEYSVNAMFALFYLTIQQKPAALLHLAFGFLASGLLISKDAKVVRELASVFLGANLAQRPEILIEVNKALTTILNQYRIANENLRNILARLAKEIDEMARRKPLSDMQLDQQEIQRLSKRVTGIQEFRNQGTRRMVNQQLLTDSSLTKALVPREEEQ